MRLKSHVTASALLRRAGAAGLFATVVHKGDPDGGLVWVKVREGDEAALWAERYGTDGAGGGFAPRTEGFVPEAEADEVVRKEREFDRDLWLLEVEGAGGEALVTEG